MNTLVVSALYSREKPITTCAPDSLRGWFTANKIQNNQPAHCDVSVQEVQQGRWAQHLLLETVYERNVSSKYWDELDRRLREDDRVKIYRKVI